MTVADGFVDAVLASPLAVSTAVDLIAEMSFGRLVDAAVFTGLIESGPWMGDAPAKIAAAYGQAERRAPIVEAINERFADQLHAPIDRPSQQWFTDGHPWLASRSSLFGRLDEVHGAGEFPISGLWTAARGTRGDGGSLGARDRAGRTVVAAGAARCTGV